uniref:Transmembrane protein n=1 Tax=Gadus morhua TaxID=8049 RepID=A0A8C5CVW7_GADMO
MTQNMFQEGLYQVFVRETQSERPPPEASDEGDLRDARIRRWFGTVVGSRVCVTGVQAVSALACILSTVTYSCVSFNCSMSMTMPVWSSVFVRSFITRTGALALLLPKKPTKINAVVCCSASCQRIGSRVAEGSAITFTGLCLLASLYTLFLTWRGLRRYSAPNSQTYGPVPQVSTPETTPLRPTAQYHRSLVCVDLVGCFLFPAASR